MKQNRSELILASVLIVAAALSKVLTHPQSFDPIIGMALFSGAIIKDKRYAFALPIFAMFLSDVILEVSGIAKGFYGWSQLVNYGILVLITMLGSSLKKISALRVAGFSLASSAIFFIISNLAFFLIDNRIYHLYPDTFSGFVDCYVKALPFFKWHVDLIFSAVLFGSYYLLTQFSGIGKRVAA